MDALNDDAACRTSCKERPLPLVHSCQPAVGAVVTPETGGGLVRGGPRLDLTHDQVVMISVWYDSQVLEDVPQGRVLDFGNIPGT